MKLWPFSEEMVISSIFQFYGFFILGLLTGLTVSEVGSLPWSKPQSEWCVLVAPRVMLLVHWWPHLAQLAYFWFRGFTVE